MANPKFDPYKGPTPGGSTTYGGGGVNVNTTPLQIQPFAGGMGDVSKQIAALVGALAHRGQQSQGMPMAAPTLPRSMPGMSTGERPVSKVPGAAWNPGRPIWTKYLAGQGLVRLSQWEPGADFSGYDSNPGPAGGGGGGGGSMQAGAQPNDSWAQETAAIDSHNSNILANQIAGMGEGPTRFQSWGSLPSNAYVAPPNPLSGTAPSTSTVKSE